MKTRIVTLISVVGVLVAGTAAAMVNTQIFESDPTVAGESAALLAPEPTTVDLSVDADSSSTTAAAGDRSSGTLTEFAVGDAGFVTLDVIGDRLRIVSAEPVAGWTVVEAEEYPDGDEIEVTFASGSTAIEFDAYLIDGRIQPEIEMTSAVDDGRDDDGDDDDHDDDRDEVDDDDDDDDDRAEVDDDDDERDDDERDDDERDDD